MKIRTLLLICTCSLLFPLLGNAANKETSKMNELKIIAVIVAKEAHKDEVLKALHTVVDGTRKEAGNISYVLHQDVQKPLKFTIIEVWKDQEAIDAHNQTSHFLALGKALDGKVDQVTIDIIREIY